MTQTFYIAGPMQGLPLYNFPAFFRAARALREAGYLVHNPAETDMARGLNPGEPLDSTNNAKVFNLQAVLKEDFEVILVKCQGLVLLPSWRKSTGAKAEVVVAHYSGKQIWELIWNDECPRGLGFDLVLMEDKPTITFTPVPEDDFIKGGTSTDAEREYVQRIEQEFMDEEA